MQRHAEGGPAGEEGRGEPVPVIIAGGEVVVPPILLAKKFGSLDHGHKTMDEVIKLICKREIERLKTAPPPNGADTFSTPVLYRGGQKTSENHTRR